MSPLLPRRANGPSAVTGPVGAAGAPSAPPRRFGRWSRSEEEACTFAGSAHVASSDTRPSTHAACAGTRSRHGGAEKQRTGEGYKRQHRAARRSPPLAGQSADRAGLGTPAATVTAGSVQAAIRSVWRAALRATGRRDAVRIPQSAPRRRRRRRGAQHARCFRPCIPPVRPRARKCEHYACTHSSARGHEAHTLSHRLLPAGRTSLQSSSPGPVTIPQLLRVAVSLRFVCAFRALEGTPVCSCESGPV